MKRALVLLSKHQFNPMTGKGLATSVGTMAKSVYTTLVQAGFTVDYIDPAETATFEQKEYDLFVGQLSGWDQAAERSRARIKVLFMVTTHPLRRNKLMREAAKKWGLKAEELLDADAKALKAFDKADYILQIGNEFAVKALLDYGVSQEKIIHIHYGLNHIVANTQEQKHDLNTFLHAAAGLGFRKGTPETLELFETDLKSKKLTLVGEFYKNEPNYNYWQEKLKETLKNNTNISYAGFVPSDSEKYKNIVESHGWLVFPTIEDAEPAVVLETMARGVVPLMIPEGSGINFSITDAYTDSVKDQANRAARMTREQWKVMSAKAKHYVELFHNHADWEHRLVRVWQTIIEKPASLKPTASIILSIFNKEKHIAELLNDLWETTKQYEKWDLHIIYDGCVDKTKDRAREAFAKFTVPVYEYETPNIFETRTNNLGLQKASGRYCVILQDDNFLSEVGWLERIVAWMEEHPRAAAVGGLAGVNYFPLEANPQGLSVVKEPREVYQRIDWRLDQRLKDYVYEVDAVMRGPIVLRKDLLDKHGYLDEAYVPLHNDDMDYCFRMKKLGYGIFCFPIGVENRELTVAKHDPEKRKFWLAAVEKNQKQLYTRWQNDMGKHDHFIKVPRPQWDVFSKTQTSFIVSNTYTLEKVKSYIQSIPRTAKTSVKNLLTRLPHPFVIFFIKKFAQAGSLFTKLSKKLAIYALEPRTIPWNIIGGDESLRLNYDLNENSIVFDMGGYQGAWADQIFCKYGCMIHIFEPVESFAKNIKQKFEKNRKIIVHACALGNREHDVTLSLDANATSAFVAGKQTTTMKVHKASQYLKHSGISSIDLMKINIEGGEYDLLEELIESGMVKNIKNLQIQFHDFAPNARERMKKIQETLKKTHHLTYHYEFVWENWERNG